METESEVEFLRQKLKNAECMIEVYEMTVKLLVAVYKQQKAVIRLAGIKESSIITNAVKMQVNAAYEAHQEITGHPPMYEKLE